MRFFKAFSLLHRRTKSDIFVSGSAGPPDIPASLFGLATSQSPVNIKHLNDYASVVPVLPVFGLENELNARLTEANNHWAKEYANLQCQLQECREELHTERREVQCLQHKLEEDNRIILDLRMSLKRLQGFCDVSNHAVTGSRQDAVSGGTGMLQNVSAMPNIVKDSFSNVMNIRTMNEYSSALRMTLATRKELRNQKKVSLFWKRKALDSNHFQSTITPSVSTISSIHDPLPAGRQIALDALISRRGLDSILGSRIEWRDTPSSPPKLPIEKLPIHQPVDEVGSSIAIARLPAMSSKNSSSSRLGPLASESIKAEISSLFGSPDSVKHLTPRIRRGPDHSPSLVRRLTKFTLAISTPAKKTDLNVESFGDLHAIFATTFGADNVLVDKSNNTLNQVHIEDDISISMNSVLPPQTSVPVSPSRLTRSVFKTSNIPTRKGAVTSGGSHNEVVVNKLKQASKDYTPHRSWKSYKARSATTKVKTVSDAQNVHQGEVRKTARQGLRPCSDENSRIQRKS